MKALLASLALSLIALSACGTSTDTSVTASPKPTPKAERLVSTLDATLGAVVVKAAPAPAVGLWTEATVQVQVDCTAKLETFSAAPSQGQDGRAQILVSAFVSMSVNQEPLRCQAFSIEERTISFPGVVDASDIDLVNLSQARAEIPAGTMGVGLIDTMEVVSTRQLCLDGRVCAVSGVIVTLRMPLGACIASLGPVSYHAEQVVGADDRLSIKLAVSAVQFVHEDSRLVRCDALPVVLHEITLPYIYGDAETLELVVLN